MEARTTIELTVSEDDLNVNDKSMSSRAIVRNANLITPENQRGRHPCGSKKMETYTCYDRNHQHQVNCTGPRTWYPPYLIESEAGKDAGLCGSHPTLISKLSLIHI